MECFRFGASELQGLGFKITAMVVNMEYPSVKINRTGVVIPFIVSIDFY